MVWDNAEDPILVGCVLSTLSFLSLSLYFCFSLSLSLSRQRQQFCLGMIKTDPLSISFFFLSFLSHPCLKAIPDAFRAAVELLMNEPQGVGGDKGGKGMSRGQLGHRLLQPQFCEPLLSISFNSPAGRWYWAAGKH